MNECDGMSHADCLLDQEYEYLSPIMVIRWQKQGNLPFSHDNWSLEYVSTNARDIVGYSSQQLMSGEIPFLRIVHRDDLDYFPINTRKFNESNGEHFEFGPYRIINPDGKFIWVEDRTVKLRNKDGQVTLCITYLIDITERKLAEEMNLNTSEKIENLHEIAHGMAVCKTEEDVYKLTVDAAERILHLSMSNLDVVEEEKLVPKAMSSGFPPGGTRVMDIDEGLAGETYRTSKTFVFGNLSVLPDVKPALKEFKSVISAPIGDIGVFQVFSTEINAFSGNDVRLLELLLGHTVEAQRRIRLQNKLVEQAIHDPLTGVYNRYYLNQALNLEIKRSSRYSRPITFLMIDVDRFKEINDRYGHQAGDKVLQKVASLLLDSIRDSDVVVRYGGDEFLIIMPETLDEADYVKQRIIASMDTLNIMEESVAFPVTVSIGSASWKPGDWGTFEDILARADKRMYETKMQKH